jgi:hypothetical protein
MNLLPIRHIRGTPFYVDLRRMEFRQVANPANRITFFDLRDNGDHLILLYDTETRNAYQSPVPNETKPAGIIVVRLPPLDKLDPFTYALLKGRHDTRLEQLNKAARLFDPPAEPSSSQRNKLK